MYFYVDGSWLHLCDESLRESAENYRKVTGRDRRKRRGDTGGGEGEQEEMLVEGVRRREVKGGEGGGQTDRQGERL